MFSNMKNHRPMKVYTNSNYIRYCLFFYIIALPEKATISTDSANSTYMISWHNHETSSKVSFYCEKLTLSFHLASNGGYSIPDILKNPDLISEEDNIDTKIELIYNSLIKFISRYLIDAVTLYRELFIIPCG